MAQPTNLYDFYKGKLPSLTQRGQLYQQYGLGQANTYSGLAGQNTALLNTLLKQPQTAVPAVQGVSQAPNINQQPYNPPAPPVPQAPTQPTANVPSNAPYTANVANAFTQKSNSRLIQEFNPDEYTANLNNRITNGQISVIDARSELQDAAQKSGYSGPLDFNKLGSAQPSTNSLTPQDTLAAGGSQVATPEQQAISKSLERLNTLYDQLSKTNTNPQVLADLDKTIAEQSLALANLTPEKFLQTEPGLQGVGINQEALERRVAQARDPIAGALTKLLIGRSSYGATLAQEQQRIQQQIQLTGQQTELELALAQLSKPKVLQTNFDEASGTYQQLIEQPGGQITTRNIQTPEIATGLNPYEYKQSVDLITELAKKGIDLGIPVGQPKDMPPFSEITSKAAAALASKGGIELDDKKKYNDIYFGDERIQQFQIQDAAYTRLNTIGGMQKDRNAVNWNSLAGKKTSVDEITTIWARSQRPDIARGADAGDPNETNALLSLARQKKDELLADKNALPDKLKQTVISIDNLYQAAKALKRSRDADFKAQFGDAYKIPDLQTSQFIDYSTVVEAPEENVAIVEQLEPAKPQKSGNRVVNWFKNLFKK